LIERPKDGLDSRSLGHFAGLRRIDSRERFVRYQKLELENQQHSNQTTTTTLKHLPEQQQQHSHGLRIPSRAEQNLFHRKIDTLEKNNNKPKRLGWLGHLLYLPFSLCPKSFPTFSILV